MSQPPPQFNRSFNFTDFSTNTPNLQQPGNKIDQELNNVQASLNATISRLNEIQRDDGLIRDTAFNGSGLFATETSNAIASINTAGSTNVASVNSAGATIVASANSSASSASASATAANNAKIQAQAARDDAIAKAAEVTAAETHVVAIADGIVASASTIPGLITQAQTAASQASTSATSASSSASSASSSATSAATSASQASTSASNASASASQAATSATSAANSASQAASSAASVANAIPTGGTVGQVLTKTGTGNYVAAWQNPQGSVTSVAGRTGAVTLTTADIGGLGSIATASTSDYATPAYVNTAIASLVDSAPGTLNTLNELATALGNDPNFATTVTNSIATKASKSANLSDLDSIPTARINLGLGSAATQNASAFLQTANNLSDVTPATARTNLGLGSMAVETASNYATTTALSTGLAGKADTVHTHAIADVTNLQSSLDAKSPLASPSFTGTPTAPTALAGTNTTQLATTAFVTGGLAGKANTSHTHTIADVTGLQAALDLEAPLNSPALTGIPTAPTAAVNTNTTQLATTAYVIGQASTTTPIASGTAAVGTSTTFARADHVHPTDTTRAPLASPTFTGTVTIPAGASIAGYLQTANNLSEVTPATARTNLGLAYATDAQTVAGASSTTVVSPANVYAIRPINRYGREFDFGMATWTTHSSGTVNVIQSAWAKSVINQTNVGYGALSFSISPNFSTTGGNTSYISFDASYEITFTVSWSEATTSNDSIKRLGLGKNSTYVAGDLTVKGFNLRRIGRGVLELQVHDGTTLTTVASTFNPSTTVGQFMTEIKLTSNGLGTCTLWANGTQIASTTGGPTGISGIGNTRLFSENQVLNTLTTAHQLDTYAWRVSRSF